MNIFCLLGLHNWVHFEKWEPHIRAEIVTKVTFTNCCANCGKEENTPYSSMKQQVNQ